MPKVNRRAALQGAIALMANGWLAACGGGGEARSAGSSEEAAAAPAASNVEVQPATTSAPVADPASSASSAPDAGAGAGSTGTSSVPAADGVSQAPASTSTGLPAWAATAASGTWTQLPMARRLSDVNPLKSALYNPNYPATAEWAENDLRQSAIVNAWCGAAYDESADTMWLGLGGGHRDYAGNEVYACDFATDAPAWRMVRPPSGAVGNLLTTDDGQEATGVYADGRPRATHSYNKWVHVPGVGPVLMHPGASAWRANGGKTWGLFLDAGGEARFTEATPLLSLDRAEGTGVCYDPTRHAIWLVEKNTSAVVRYDIGSPSAWLGRYLRVGAAWSRQAQVASCYLPTLDSLLILHSSGFSNSDPVGQRGAALFDCQTGAVRPITLNGWLPGLHPGLAQPRWVADLGAVCLWNNFSDDTRLITRLTPPTRADGAWGIDTLALSSANAGRPEPAAVNGTYGRFAWSPRLKGFVVFSATDGPTWFYKL